MANSVQVLVPDIGGFKDVSVIDVLVKAGQQIDKETPLITLETEKAAMDVPAPAAGRITEVRLKQGDKVSEGSLILLIEPDATAESTAPQSAAAQPPTAPPPAPAGAAAAPAPAAAPAGAAATSAPAAAPAGAAVSPVSAAAAAPAPAPPLAAAPTAAASAAYASPSVRKLARELGADLGMVSGTGTKGRITHDDVKALVKRILSAPPAPPSSPLPKVPEVDFALFGPVEVAPLSRIQKISGARLQASWINLPHVTQHEDADITDLETVRAALKDKASQEGVRLTPLAFIIKACIAALREFPRFNSSLDPRGENLVLKKYISIGFAADTPNGLVVPVIANADRLNLYEIARVLAVLSEKARAGKLKAAEMQGGTFTVSSLGGIGGTAFTPIINAPEVAILGVSKSSHKPVFIGGAFVPRLTLPLSLSYDHRVIDGAAAARFIVYLARALGDVKALL